MPASSPRPWRQTPEVKKFAQLMVTDHTGVNKSAIDLVTKLKVTPEDNPTSQSLKTGGETNLANLKTLKGAAFDKAYIDHEVAYHQAGARRGRQDADPGREERGAEGAARQGASGVRRPPRAREALCSRRSRSNYPMRRRTVRYALISSVATVALLLCSAGHGTAEAKPTNTPPRSRERSFNRTCSPSTAAIRSCGRTRIDSRTRSLRSPAVSTRSRSSQVSPGLFRPSKAGEFEYVCSLHPTMKASSAGEIENARVMASHRAFSGSAPPGQVSLRDDSRPIPVAMLKEAPSQPSGAAIEQARA